MIADETGTQNCCVQVNHFNNSTTKHFRRQPSFLSPVVYHTCITVTALCIGRCNVYEATRSALSKQKLLRRDNTFNIARNGLPADHIDFSSFPKFKCSLQYCVLTAS